MRDKGFAENHGKTLTASPQPPVRARRAVGALFFMNGALIATWVSRIPAVEAERGYNHARMGLALLALAFGALISMPIAGASSARYGSDRVCRIATLLYCIMLPFVALAPNSGLFMLSLILFGSMHGTLDVAMNAQAVAVEKAYERPIMSSFHAVFSFGGLTGAALGGLVAGFGSTPLLHFFSAAFLMGAFCGLLALPHLFRADASSASRTTNVLAKKRSLNRPPGALIGLGVIAFCVMMGEGAMADWSALFLRRVLGAGEGFAATGYAAFSIFMAAGRLFGDRLSERFGPVNLVRASGVLSIAGLGLALFGGHAAASLAGFAAVGAGFATVVPQVFTAAGRIPGVAAASALAIVTTLGYLGFLIGPPVIGFAAERFDLRSALGILLVTSALLVVLAPFLRPSARGGCQSSKEGRLDEQWRATRV